MKAIVFVGPTLAKGDAAAILDAVYLPPVAQGDVYRAATRAGPPWAIGIIDGYFERTPAVWHKEILWAMARGIHVFGSASMGALRAAELVDFGMEGVGEVFEAYRDGKCEDDDEVAVVHGPPEDGYPPLSEAMVNIRATLGAAEAAGILSAGLRVTLEAMAKETFYAERSYPLLLRRAAQEGASARELGELEAWLPCGRINQKRLDALAMLRTMAERARSDRASKSVDYRVAHTKYWDAVMRSAGTSPAGPGDTQAALLPEAVLDELRLRGMPYLAAREKGLLRSLALSEARYRGHRASDTARASKQALFLRAHNLGTPDALARWLEDNDVSGRRFQELMEEEVLVEQATTGRDLMAPVLEHLRITGDYGALRARALDKLRHMERTGLGAATVQDTRLTLEALLAWYFQRLRRAPPVDLDEYARVFGFQDSEAFVRSVVREYLYMTREGRAP